MFPIAKDKTHFSESRVRGLFAAEANRPAFHVQIVLASVPLRGQQPAGRDPLARSIPHPKPAARSRQVVKREQDAQALVKGRLSLFLPKAVLCAANASRLEGFYRRHISPQWQWP